MTKRRLEPLLWLLFSGGGVVSAVFPPCSSYCSVWLFRWDVVRPDYDHLHAVFSFWLTPAGRTRFACSLMLFHWAHRFRYTLHDGLRLKRLEAPRSSATAVPWSARLPHC
jgi:fumarate reductase subunit D